MFQGNRCVLDLMAFPVGTVGHWGVPAYRSAFEYVHVCAARKRIHANSVDHSDVCQVRWVISGVTWIEFKLFIHQNKYRWNGEKFSLKSPVYWIKGDFITVRTVMEWAFNIYKEFPPGFTAICVQQPRMYKPNTGSRGGGPHVFTFEAASVPSRVWWRLFSWLQSETSLLDSTHWTFPQTAQITWWKYRQPSECELKPG